MPENVEEVHQNRITALYELMPIIDIDPETVSNELAASSFMDAVAGEPFNCEPTLRASRVGTEAKWTLDVTHYNTSLYKDVMVGSGEGDNMSDVILSVLSDSIGRLRKIVERNAHDHNPR